VYPMYFLAFNLPVTDDIMDLLLQTVYLMLRSGQEKRGVSFDFCEGIVTGLGPVTLYGMEGIQFAAHLYTGNGELKTTFMVRPQDLRRMEAEDPRFGAWLTLQDMLQPPTDLKDRIRPNPLAAVSRSHRSN